MHISEFRAWFEGFTEDMTKPPNAKQWGRIKKRVKEITAESTPWPIFIDRYVRPYRDFWPRPQSTWMTTNAAPDIPVDTMSVFADAGRAELQSMRTNT